MSIELELDHIQSISEFWPLFPDFSNDPEPHVCHSAFVPELFASLDRLEFAAPLDHSWLVSLSPPDSS